MVPSAASPPPCAGLSAQQPLEAGDLRRGLAGCAAGSYHARVLAAAVLNKPLGQG